MPSPATATDFIGLVRKSGLLDPAALSELADRDLPDEPFACAEALVKGRVLTPFQAKQILAGRYRGLVLGAYRILRPLGKGGMGVVYLAEHAGLNRKVAIKVLTQDQAQEKLALERFYREARAAAALDHPNIVRLHDINQFSGVHFLVMEYVEGLDLHSLMEQTGALHYSQAVNYIAQAAAGLRHAHGRNFVHRDIKPANLILAKDGTVKILDMGLARSLQNPKDALTGKLSDDEDVITGTADYLSPEQALNLSLDARSDIYSLGATFFTLVTGRPPFGGSTKQKLTQHQVAAPPNLCKLRASVPEELNDVVVKMMAKKPSDRFQSVQDVLDALEPWTSSHEGATGEKQPTTTRRSDSTGRKLPKAKKSKRGSGDADPAGLRAFLATRNGKLAIGGVSLLLLVGVLYAAIGGSKKPETAKSDPGPSQPGPVKPGPIGLGNGGTPPATTTPGAVVRFDGSQVVPFRMVRDAQGALEGTTPLLPPGWVSEVWNMDATGEFRSETIEGRRAIRVASTKGTNAAQFVFRPAEVGDGKVTTDRSYRVRIDYHTDPGVEGYLHIQTRDDYAWLGRMVLKNQGQGWYTATGTIRPGGKDFQIAIGSTRTLPGKFVSVSHFELIPESAVPSDKPVYSFDFSRVAAFKFKYQDGQHGDADWLNKVPRGIYLHCWKKESVAEFRGETADARASIGVANLNNDVSSQILFQFDEGLNLGLKAGSEYRVRLEYRTMNDAEGRVDIRNPKGSDFSSIADTRLEATDGKWKSVELSFRRPADGKIDVCVVNNSVGEGNVLSVRSVEVLEVSK